MWFSRVWITNAETIVAFCFVMFILVTTPHISSALTGIIWEETFIVINRIGESYNDCLFANDLLIDIYLCIFYKKILRRKMNYIFEDNTTLLKLSEDLAINRYKSVQKFNHLETQTVSSQLQEHLSHIDKKRDGMARNN
jgi:hypothetical protein